MIKPKGIGVRYCELSKDFQLRIYEFIMKEATKMQKLNYHELARTILLNFGVHVWPNTIRDWIVKGKSPLQNPKYGMNTKAIRKPPDNNIIPDFLGLIYSDLHFRRLSNTLWLSLTTTYEAWAIAVTNRFNTYGYVNVLPTLCVNTPEWRANIYLDAISWADAFKSPLELTCQDAIRFLARVIDGDGWISLVMSEERSKKAAFVIGISTSHPNKARMFEEVINIIGWSISKISRLKHEERAIDTKRIIKSRRREHLLILYRKDEVAEFLKSVKMLHPFKEVRRLWALKILDEEMDRERASIIWRHVYLTEKIAKVYSQLKATEQLITKFVDVNDQRKLEKLLSAKEGLSNKLLSLRALLKQTIEMPTIN